MKAMILRRVMSLQDGDEPLECVEMPRPRPAGNEVLIRVLVCGVCRTEIDEIEGRTPPPAFPVVPGHEIIGRVVQTGADVSLLREGDRVGVGWIHSSSGDELENLSDEFRATGRDVHGGYAEFMTVPEAYAFRIPEVFDDITAAPLMCAGAVGYRALRLARLRNGQRLGLTGFGGCAHIVLQLARHLFPDSPVSVFARSAAARELAEQLGAAWTGKPEDRPPQRLDAVIDTTPVWSPVLHALECLRPNGRLIINAIRKESSDTEVLSKLSYDRHLWMEREIKTVANVTRFDIQEFLPLAAEIPVRTETETYPLESANQALLDLKRGPVRGAKVLLVDAAGPQSSR